MNCSECRNLSVGTGYFAFCQGIVPITVPNQCAGFVKGSPKNIAPWRKEEKNEGSKIVNLPSR